MTRQKLPDVCDLCGKDIENQSQYLFEVYEGKSSFGQERSHGRNMDCCHKCFLQVCAQGYKPEWKHEYKNPNYGTIMEPLTH